MKKRVCIISGILLLLVIVVVFGYIRINNMYPPSRVVEADMGEELEYQEGVMISVDKAEYISNKQRDNVYEKIGIEPVSDLKILEVTIMLENVTKESKKMSMTDLHLETTGASNGISKVIIDVSEGRYGSLTQELQPGEKKQIILPYEVLPNLFSKKIWNEIEKQKFWLTFSSYPEKTKLNLRIGVYE